MVTAVGNRVESSIQADLEMAAGEMAAAAARVPVVREASLAGAAAAAAVACNTPRPARARLETVVHRPCGEHIDDRACTQRRVL